jgi:hypothetical protein
MPTILKSKRSAAGRLQRALGAAARLAPAGSHVLIAVVCGSDIAELILHFVRGHMIQDQ